jgi:hypothetical protein
MDWLIHLGFLIACLCVIWAFVTLVRRTSRNNKTLRWLWILGLGISSFLFILGLLASMGSGTGVFYVCMQWDGKSMDDSYCYSPETRSQVSREFWLQAMLPPSVRDPMICWAFYTAQHCRPVYSDGGWDYYFLQIGIALFFAFTLGFLVWRSALYSR